MGNNVHSVCIQILVLATKWIYPLSVASFFLGHQLCDGRYSQLCFSEPLIEEAKLGCYALCGFVVRISPSFQDL